MAWLLWRLLQPEDGACSQTGNRAARTREVGHALLQDVLSIYVCMRSMDGRNGNEFSGVCDSGLEAIASANIYVQKAKKPQSSFVYNMTV